MAGYGSGKYYDVTWDNKHEVALRILRRLADRCAGRGTAKTAYDKVLAIILNVFRDDFFNQHRTPELWSLCRAKTCLPSCGYRNLS